MDRLRRALDAVFPIIFQGGITRAMYRAEGEDLEEPDGVAVDYQEWPVIESAARSMLDAPRIAWCLNHSSASTGDSGLCEAMEGELQPWASEGPDDCRIVGRLLVEEPE